MAQEFSCGSLFKMFCIFLQVLSSNKHNPGQGFCQEFFELIAMVLRTHAIAEVAHCCPNDLLNYLPILDIRSLLLFKSASIYWSKVRASLKTQSDPSSYALESY